MFFRAKNGTFKRVSLKPNVGFEQANGGMTIYYTPYYGTKVNVQAFKPVSSSEIYQRGGGGVEEHLKINI